MSTLLIIGGTGELGRKTVAAAEATDGSGWDGEIIATCRSSMPPKTSERVQWQSLDVSDHKAVRTLLLSKNNLSCVIYCAIPKGGNANAKHSGELRAGIIDDVLHCAESVALMGIRFIAISTDLVFDGKLTKGKCYDEQSETSPINTYGQYKAEMEEKLSKIKGNIVIARTSLILTMDKIVHSNKDCNSSLVESYDYGKGMKFVVDCLLGKHGKIELFTDELRNMSFADDLGRALIELSQPECTHTGMIHLVSDECSNRWELAKLLAKVLNLEDLLGKYATSGLCSASGLSNTRPQNCQLYTQTRAKVLKTPIRGISDRLAI